MSDARRPITLAAAVLAAAATVLIAAEGQTRSITHPPASPSSTQQLSTGRPSRPGTELDNASPRRAAQARRAAVKRTPGPRTVAARFANGYLACAYMHARCLSVLPGVLPALSRELARRHGAAFPTPAERSARPRITGVRLTYECPDGAAAAVKYTDGSGDAYELDPALVREPNGWHVWNLNDGAGTGSQHWPLRGEC